MTHSECVAAARMETTSEPGRVQLSESSATHLMRQSHDLSLVKRGEIPIKGKVREGRSS